MDVSAGSKDEVTFSQDSREKAPVEPEDVTTVTDGKVLVTPRGNIRVISNSGIRTVSGLKNRKKKIARSAAAKSRRRKLKSVPKLVSAMKDEDSVPCVIEIKQEPEDEMASVKKQLVAKGKSIEVHAKNLKKKNVCDEKARTDVNVEMKIESTDEASKASSTKSLKVKKSILQRNKNSAVTPEPPKKKRKV